MVALLRALACFAAPAARAQRRPHDRGQGRDQDLYAEGVARHRRRAQRYTIADPVYRRTMTYRAIPLASLLKGTGIDADDYVQGAPPTISRLPFRAALPPPRSAVVEAFVAIEDPAPWPPMHRASRTKRAPARSTSSGAAPCRCRSRSEYYHAAALAVIDSPLKRWPGLAVGPGRPSGRSHSHRPRPAGGYVACHRFNGEGRGRTGP